MHRLRRDPGGPLALLAAAVLVELVDVPIIRTPAGLALLVLPAYWWSRVALPTLGPRSAERLLATLALTATVTISTALLLNLVSIHLTDGTWTLAALVVGLAGWGVARITEPEVVPEPATPSSFTVERSRWLSPTRRDLVLTGIAVVILAGTALLARAPLSAPDKVSGYSQLSLVPKGSGFELEVQSFELEPLHYRVDVLSDGVVTQHWDDVALAPRQQFVQDVPLAGSLIEARLYRLNDTSPDPYRSVHVVTGATPPPSS